MAIYMKIKGIDGDVTAQGHENWIALKSLDFDVKRIISTDPGRIADREGTRPSLSEINLTKKTDKSSPLLFSEACVGKAKSEVKIHICQTGNSLSPYLELTLNNVIVSSYYFDCNEFNTDDKKHSNYPVETVTLSYDKIEVRYTPYDSKNQAQSPIPAGYDLKQAVAA